MKFVCGQCWREGQVNEPDKNLKYCTAKARHSWTKERRVLLVKSFEKKKWVVVRPLPFSRTYPQQYDMCVHVMKQKKCHYIGNCSFAHSLEERDVWTYMKNNSLRDMQQMYELWLQLTNQCRRTDNSAATPPPDDKQVTITADYTEGMAAVIVGVPETSRVDAYHFREADGCRTGTTSERCRADQRQLISTELQTGLPHQLQLNRTPSCQSDLL